MTLELAVDLLANLLRTGLIIAVPILGTALAIGVSVSLIQSITSLQEQTLTFVPKLRSADSGSVLTVGGPN